MSNIKKYKMCLNVVTPLHIGSGQELSKLDYIYIKKEKKVVILDKTKFMDHLSKKNKLDTFITEVSKSFDDIDLYGFLERNGLKNDIENFKLREYNSGLFFNSGRLNTVHLMTKNAMGEPYIQGSSIKGAITTAIVSSYLKNNREKYSQTIDDIYRMSKRRVNEDKEYKGIQRDISKKLNSLIDTFLYAGSRNRVKDFGLSISDSYHSENVQVAFLKDYDLSRTLKERNNDTEPKEMPITREYILPGAKFYFDLTINYDYFEASEMDINSINDILDLVDDFSYSLVTEEFDLDFPTEEQIENSKKVEYDMRDVLIMGANTGFLQKTVVNSLFEDKQKALEVTRVLLHKSSKKKALSHKNDIYSPRVINYVLGNDYELSGLCQIKQLKEGSKDLK